VITVVTGDLLKSSADALVNPVNCVGVAGAGLALQFRLAWPDYYADYQAACRSGGLRPGTVHVFRQPHGRWLISAPTKEHWRTGSSMDLIRDTLSALRTQAEIHDFDSMAMPALGCGLGGLNWDDVRQAVEESLGDLRTAIYLYAPRLIPAT
jgi:O-acetyl-ADP-ribose deacetylase (regulator of RNase III)